MMVCESGMSEKLGPIAYGQRDEQPFLGRDFGMNTRDYSEDTAITIDTEVRRIIGEQQEIARRRWWWSRIGRRWTDWPRHCSSVRRSTSRRSKRASTGARCLPARA